MSSGLGAGDGSGTSENVEKIASVIKEKDARPMAGRVAEDGGKRGYEIP